ncbi:MAG: 3-coathanger stack domain-containing protein [Candidatus Methylacidiphilales bacterium]
MICTNTTDVIQASNSTYNFNTYSYGVKNNIIFGGTNCIAKVTNGMNVSLRAKTSIELKGGFEVEAGGEFYANICECTP